MNITDLTARRLASNWHDGQFSALYALLSTGAIDHDAAEKELNNAIYINSNEPDNVAELVALRHYVYVKGNRGPQKGWGCLAW